MTKTGKFKTITSHRPMVKLGNIPDTINIKANTSKIAKTKIAKLQVKIANTKIAKLQK